MDKKYTVFISSTYEDLKDERSGVADTILRAGDFPIGMEAFPAADEEQFEFIKAIIDECDYYILIVAGRYGSLAPDGLSYTEKEFDYAIQQGVPVLPLIHDKRGAIYAEKTEKEHPKKLEAFIEKARTGRMCKFWNTADGLKLAVRETLDHAKKTKTRTGWIRSDKAIRGDAATEILALKKENERLKKLVERESFPDKLNLKGLDDEIEIVNSKMGIDSENRIKDVNETKVMTLSEIWSLVALHFYNKNLSDVYEPIFPYCPLYSYKSDVDRVKLSEQFDALGLLNPADTKSGYCITPKGRQVMQKTALFYKED